jgi:hypothetical protein
MTTYCGILWYNIHRRSSPVLKDILILLFAVAAAISLISVLNIWWSKDPHQGLLSKYLMLGSWKLGAATETFISMGMWSLILFSK